MLKEATTRSAARWFRVAAEPEALLVCFATPVGHCGALFRGDQIVRSTLGQPSDDALRQHLLEESNSSPSQSFVSRDSADFGPHERALRMTRVDAIDGRKREWAERFRAFFDTFTDDLADLPLDFSQTTDFQRRTLEACRRIRPGETCTYAELAQRVGSPGAARAVGNVMRTNRFAPIVPCHRVVGSDGHLGGYSAPTGLTLKRRLLALEAERAPDA